MCLVLFYFHKGTAYMIVATMGLIGAGKSTLTRMLREKHGYTTFMEPTSESEGASDNPFLEDYYKNPRRWAFTMQAFLLFERYKQFQEAHYRSLRGETCILDSTYYSDFAFALVQHDDGYFTEKEFDAYVSMHSALQPNLVYPDLIVYLDLSPNDTLERIRKRSRDCESSIPIEYLRHLYNAYQKILSALERRCKVVRIDARDNPETVLHKVELAIADTEKELILNGHPCYK